LKLGVEQRSEDAKVRHGDIEVILGLGNADVNAGLNYSVPSQRLVKGPPKTVIIRVRRFGVMNILICVGVCAVRDDHFTHLSKLLMQKVIIRKWRDASLASMNMDHAEWEDVLVFFHYSLRFTNCFLLTMLCTFSAP